MGSAIIVGAGPAGATLAYLLAGRGVHVTLVERQHDFAREFRGEGLTPGGLDVFAQIGLAAELARVPQVRPEAAEIFLDQRFVTRLAVDPASALVVSMVSQPALLEMLVAAGAAHAGFRLLRSTAVRDLVVSDGRVVGVRAEGPDGVREIRADLVVGADGRGSIVRRRAGLEEPRDSESFDVVWFKVPYPAALDPRGLLAQAYFSRGHLTLAFPSHDGRLQVAWVIQKGTFGEIKRQGAEAWARELAAYVSPELGAHFRRHSDGLIHPFVLDVVCYLLSRWTAPGVMLLGDAAHPMSPVGGQGINIALRDAVVAANHLVPVLAADPAPAAIDAACERFARERHPEAAEIQALQRRPPEILFRRRWWAGLAVLVVPRLLRTAPGRRLAWRLVGRKMLLGTTDVRLRV